MASPESSRPDTQDALALGSVSSLSARASQKKDYCLEQSSPREFCKRGIVCDSKVVVAIRLLSRPCSRIELSRPSCKGQMWPRVQDQVTSGSARPRPSMEVPSRREMLIQ